MTVMPGWSTPLAQSTPRITLGDLELRTSGRRRLGEAIIAAVSMSGWKDKPRDTTQSSEHPSGDGTNDGLQQWGPRTITIVGFVDALDVNELAAAQERVARAAGLLVVDERALDLKREANVRLIGLSWTRVTMLHEQFTLTLLARDPLRYASAAQQLVNGANVLFNPGDATAWPTLEVVGPHAAMTITHGANVWSLAATPSGVERIVDLREGDIWQGGVRVFGLESGGAPTVPPGGATWQVAGLGAGQVRSRRNGAWT